MVDGLTIGQREQLRDQVSKKSTTLELLVRHGSVEVTRHRIEAGKHLYLDEAAEWAGFEFIYILDGELELDSDDHQIRIGVGDFLHHQGLSERAFFRVNSDVELLMVSSPPSYHLVHHEIQGMMSLARSVEEKDETTEGHCHRLERLAILTGERLGLSGQRLIDLSYGAYLHDIGKVKVPDEILNKDTALTPEEQGEIRRHTKHGATMLTEKEFLSVAAGIVATHHERFDGSGYPRGLKGEEIPIEARIIAVVDAYDAITSERPYQSAQGRSLAVEELKHHAGSQFDPRVVHAFIEVIGGDGAE